MSDVQEICEAIAGNLHSLIADGLPLRQVSPFLLDSPTAPSAMVAGVDAQGMEFTTFGGPDVDPGMRWIVLVEVAVGHGIDPVAFAREVEHVLGDPRSWGAGGRRALQRVDGGDVAFRVVAGARAGAESGDPPANAGMLRPIALRNTLYGLYFVNTRSELLEASRILDQAALDRYLFQRDAYLQRRRSLIYDGSAPREREPEEVNDTPDRSVK